MVAGFLVARIVVHVPEANVSLFAAWLMMYRVAVHGQRRYRTAVLSVCYGVIVFEGFASLLRRPDNRRAAAGPELFPAVQHGRPASLAARRAIWSRRDRQRILAGQTIELQAEREENARQAVFAERVRIARELHDVVAHHVSVIGVQAAGARRVMERQPARAAEALTSIEASSRHAVVELHRLLGFLKRTGEIEELAPQPGLAQLGKLIAEEGQAN